MNDLMPLLARDRYTDVEWEISSAGLCDEVVEYGMYPGRIVHCKQPSSPGIGRCCSSSSAFPSISLRDGAGATN